MSDKSVEGRVKEVFLSFVCDVCNDKPCRYNAVVRADCVLWTMFHIQVLSLITEAKCCVGMEVCDKCGRAKPLRTAVIDECIEEGRKIRESNSNIDAKSYTINFYHNGYNKACDLMAERLEQLKERKDK